MVINGNPMGSPNEVILSGNEDLGVGPNEFGKHSDDKNEGPPRPRIGDTLSIHLSQQSDSPNEWTLEVWVQIAQGMFMLGPAFVVPSPATGGDPPSRTVGFASCPGTIGWKVIATCRTERGAPEEIAELLIQSRQGGAATSFGVTPNPFTPPA